MNRGRSISTFAISTIAVLLFAGIYGGGLAALYLGQTLTDPFEHAAAAAALGLGARFTARQPVDPFAFKERDLFLGVAEKGVHSADTLSPRSRQTVDHRATADEWPADEGSRIASSRSVSQADSQVSTDAGVSTPDSEA